MRLEPDNPLYGIDNVPYGAYSMGASPTRLCVRYGNNAVDLGMLLGAEGDDAVLSSHSLNAFMEQGPRRWSAVRKRIQRALVGDVPSQAVFHLEDVNLHLPFEVADYVDFYASEYHAATLGRLFRPSAPSPLPASWRHLPIGYHGRASSVVVSGTDIVRPSGQKKRPDEDFPTFGPTEKLDIEAEVGFIVGKGSSLGGNIDVDAAEEHIFGVSLFNDWSARDIQAWEYVPLGPNLGKSFASSVSAWVTPLVALEAAQTVAPVQDPQVLPYLREENRHGLDLQLEVEIDGTVVSAPPYATMYWTPAQMLAHMTVNGAPSSVGDLFASGTVSGAERGQEGALIEMTQNGKNLMERNGQGRAFLEDGETVVIRATAPGVNGGRIALGNVQGTVIARDSCHRGDEKVQEEG